MDPSRMFELYVILLRMQSLKFSLLHFEITFPIHSFDIFMDVSLYVKCNVKRDGLYYAMLVNFSEIYCKILYAHVKLMTKISPLFV